MAGYHLSMTEAFDVVIIGGGLVGMSLALALDQAAGLRVLALEAQPAPAAAEPRWDERHSDRSSRRGNWSMRSKQR